MKPRLVSSREPNGRPQRGPREPSPTEVHRLRDAALRGMRDAEWGTELGRLFLANNITAAQYAAGRKYVQEAARWRSSIGVFPVHTAALERGYGRSIDADGPEGQEQAKRDRQAAERFYEAHSILAMSGLVAATSVEAVCEHNLNANLIGIRIGLQALAHHYGLTDARNSPNVRSIGLD